MSSSISHNSYERGTSDVSFAFPMIESKGKGIYQPHHLLEDIKAISENDRKRLTKGVFGDIIRSTQVRLSDLFDVNGCWSGSVTIPPGDKPVMLYTGVDTQNCQVQNLATPKNLSDPKDHNLCPRAFLTTLMEVEQASFLLHFQLKLEPPEGCTFLDGLEVRVAFGSVWKQPLSELSGGQRSLLALSLILALLLFKSAPLYILDENLMFFLNSHEAVLGQEMKVAKSGIYLHEKAPPSRKLIVQNATGFQLKSCPMIYHGALISYGRVNAM
ncbi:hypothetical protein GIB67_030146 [Kingdonia uniflora]|uniref:Uncharacterized protein n=1 Tax=Kingdonia uniflora TaxID=39325 RepID=A0A7J7LE82_9MAGN|nr:hypothetical protein GIB67_030146 [Kingdonia uniflora]